MWLSVLMQANTMESDGLRKHIGTQLKHTDDADVLSHSNVFFDSHSATHIIFGNFVIFLTFSYFRSNCPTSLLSL